MKKILCICLTLVLALGSFCALAEEDLQAQLDAANQTIAELQAQVDTYYPYYMAQIVATYGEDGIVWLKDVEEQYAALEAQYANYGISLASYGMEDSLKQDVVRAAAQNSVLLAKAAELGLDQFSEEATADLEASAQELIDGYVDYYLSYYYPDAEEITDDMRFQAESYWADNGVNYESTLENLKESAIYDAIYDYVTKDVAVNDEDIQAAYKTLIEDNKTSYVNDSSYNTDRNGGATIAWNPEGYRAVKHVLIMFDDEQSQLYSDLQSQLTSLEEEKKAIENPVESTEAPAEENAETVEEATVEPTATPEPRSVEEIDADIEACNAELDALYAELQPTADEVIAAFNEGTSFDELIEKYNEDPGMQNEPTASIGYAVSATSTTWDPAFTEGAMSIANKGEISGAVRGANGLHIIYYMDDIPAGEVSLDEIREGVEANALASKIQTTYDDQVNAWMEEANVQYYFENFGVAPVEDEAAEDEAAEEVTETEAPEEAAETEAPEETAEAEASSEASE